MQIIKKPSNFLKYSKKFKLRPLESASEEIERETGRRLRSIPPLFLLPKPEQLPEPTGAVYHPDFVF